MRVALGRSVFYRGSITDSAVIIASTDLNIESLLLTNVTGIDVTVTLTTNETSPTTEAVFVVGANDQLVKDYGKEQGPWWFFQSGLKVSAGTSGSVRYQITGNQRP